MHEHFRHIHETELDFGIFLVNDLGLIIKPFPKKE